MPLNTKTVGDVLDYVKRQFGDESGVQLQDTDIFRWINQGQMEIVSKNLVLRATSTTTVVAGTDTYDKPLDCLRITAIKFDTDNSTPNLLSYIGFDDYQNKYQGQVQSSLPLNWTQYGDSIILAPTPSSTYDNASMILYYVPEPEKVTGEGTTLAIPDRYFDRLCEYVMSKAYELDEDWEAHSVQRNLFEQNLTQQTNEEVTANGPYPVIVDYLYY